MATFYVLRSRVNGKLYQQENRGTYREVVPNTTLEGIRFIHDLMIFTSREEAEQFLVNPRPWRIENPKAAEVYALDMELRALPLDPNCEVHVYIMGDGRCTCKQPKAIREHVVTDQGNGGSYCSHCGHDLDGAPYPCPGCGLKWEEGSISGYGFGGSDF